MGRLENLLKEQKLGSHQKSHSASYSSLPPAIKPLWKCVACEFIGTFLLIFIGCAVGLTLPSDTEKKPWVLVALCWAFVIATLGQTLHYSCDINPSVTLAKLATGKHAPLTALLYVPTQCLGCLAGAYALKLLLPEDIVGNFGITTVAPGVAPGKAVVIEAICTFFLVFTCFSADDEERDDLKGSKPLSIGLCVCAMIMAAGPFTAASFNPARTLGPSIVANNFDDHWVYWVGPLGGGLIGGLAYHFVFRLRREGRNTDEEHPSPSPV